MVPTRRRLDPRELRRQRSVNSAWWHWGVNVLAASEAISRRHRKAIMERCGFTVGDAIVESGCFFFSDNITLGPWALINGHCYLDTREHITLGERVGLSPGCMLLTSTHELGPPEQRFGPFTPKPIDIRAGAWLGARVTVLAGVTVGEGCFVAAGAVVAKDCEPNGLYGGIPARRLKDLPV